eukprot:CAMPEP_0113680700 /NCGR_PEP_ID=MMETSP0038_2-20120614/11497_1 /TAXON_ID=2898 /ORGANISM="Cryptomonas paramecium" /LENGTH=49 /DNA_ID=CAMNT_0000599175 /DNA_START=434 /DNA_END=583 /DNA_ORIENTATION=+ /assembly_acc=CAM_ASM_000170
MPTRDFNAMAANLGACRGGREQVAKLDAKSDRIDRTLSGVQRIANWGPH